MKNKKEEEQSIKKEIATFLIQKLSDYQEEKNEKGDFIPDWVLDKKTTKADLSKEEIQKMNKIWNQEMDLMILAFQNILENKKDENDQELTEVGLFNFTKCLQELD
ncbi:hypothetical protein [Aureivirga sp. CE67]|uniref:hypothetical protein n=1 Tax=Aureivirga sp. CE67 TaxID=1788983 RepID=UPI0018C8D795|nr:hypothetical protein [Aureivirga sp. CE67]